MRLSNQKKTHRLFILTLQLVTLENQVYVYTFNGIGLSEDGVYQDAMIFMQKNMPDLYSLGQKTPGGFRVGGTASYTLSQINTAFKKAAETPDNPPEVIKQLYQPMIRGEIRKDVQEILDGSRDPKNVLIRQIIETRDLDLLEDSKSALTENELAYIQDQLKC